VIDAALALMALAALAILVEGLIGVRSPFAVVAPVMIYITCFGLLMPNAVHEAIHPLPQIAGVASAVLMSAQMLFSAIGGGVAGALYRDASPLAIGIVMTAGTLSGIFVYLLWLRTWVGK